MNHGLIDHRNPDNTLLNVAQLLDDLRDSFATDKGRMLSEADLNTLSAKLSGAASATRRALEQYEELEHLVPLRLA